MFSINNISRLSRIFAAAAMVGVVLIGGADVSQGQQNGVPPSFGMPQFPGGTNSSPTANNPFANGQANPNQAIPGQPDNQFADGSVANADGTAAAESSDGKEGAIPVRNLLQIIRDGGSLMIALGICSFVLMVFVFERAIFLRRGYVIPAPFVRRVVEQLEQNQIDREEALALCEESGTPIAQLFAAACKKWGRPSVEVEQAVLDTGERVIANLRRHLRLLNAISNVAPLLGLLGTVLGMIDAFNAIATVDAMGKPELLADGISKALLTTAAGLLVAIPAYLAYMFFLGRTDRLVIEMDTLSQQVVELVSAEGQQANRSRNRSRKAAAAA